MHQAEISRQAPALPVSLSIRSISVKNGVSGCDQVSRYLHLCRGATHRDSFPHPLSEVFKLPPDPYGNDRIEKILGLDKLAVAQARAGDLIGAKATVALIASDYGGEQGMRATGSAQVWQEGIAATEEWASRLNKPLGRCYARLGIAEAASALAQGKARPKPSVWEDG